MRGGTSDIGMGGESRRNARGKSGAMRALPPAPAKIETHPVALEQAGHRHCRWPLWKHDESGGPDFLVCGAARTDGAIYCDGHAKMALGRPGAQSREGDPRPPESPAQPAEETAA